jgi:hypothetical protein
VRVERNVPRASRDHNGNLSDCSACLACTMGRPDVVTRNQMGLDRLRGGGHQGTGMISSAWISFARDAVCSPGVRSVPSRADRRRRAATTVPGLCLELAGATA